MKQLLFTIIFLMGTVSVLGGQKMSMQEAIDFARNVPAMPNTPQATSNQLSMQEAIDLGRSLSYQTGLAMREYPTAGSQYTMQEAIDFSAYQMRQAWPIGYYQPPQYAAAYAPVYYAAPNPQQNQAFVNWLFGTPPREDAPADVAEAAPEPVQVAAVIAPQPKPGLMREIEPTPTPVPTPPTPTPVQRQTDTPDVTPPDAARIAAEQAAAEQAAAEQAAAEQHLALLAQATHQAQQDAFRWMGLTIAFGLLTGGVCLYFFWQTGDKEG